MDLVDRLAAAAGELLPCAPPTPACEHLPALPIFVRQLVERARIRHAALAVALVYIRRLKPCLPQGARGDFDAPYRIVMAAILTASKFLVDTGLRNEAMSRATRNAFRPRDISRAERTFLRLIDYRLWVEPEEIMAYSMPPVPSTYHSLPVVVHARRLKETDVETASIASSISEADSAFGSMEEKL
jgi:hypothetical protein